MKETINLIMTHDVIGKIISCAKRFDVNDHETYDKIVRDIERQACRESNAYIVQEISLDHLEDVYTAIKNYKLPAYLRDEVETK